MDAPVRVRARVSPSGRSTNGLPGRIVDLAGVQAGHFPGQVGESLGDPRCAQDLREGFGLLVGEPEHLLGLVRVVAGIHHNLEVAGAPGDDADAVPVPVLELEPQTDAWQQYLFDIHGSILDDDHRPAWPTPEMPATWPR